MLTANASAYIADIDKRLSSFLKNATVKASYVFDVVQQCVHLVVNKHTYTVYFKQTDSAKDFVANVKDTISIEFPILVKTSLHLRRLSPEELADNFELNIYQGMLGPDRTLGSDGTVTEKKYQRFKLDRIQNSGKLVHGYDLSTKKPVFFRTSDKEIAKKTISMFADSDIEGFLNSIASNYQQS